MTHGSSSGFGGFGGSSSSVSSRSLYILRLGAASASGLALDSPVGVGRGGAALSEKEVVAIAAFPRSAGLATAAELPSERPDSSHMIRSMR